MRKIVSLSTLSMVAAATAMLAPSVASADAARGKQLFMRCMACHTVNKGGANKVGPNLAGVVGRKAGAVKNFKYSAAMQKADLTWDEKTLDKWLTRPATVVPGTSMVFAGLPKPEDRKSLIEYMKAAGK
ncbi:c-type cytochrome [Novosphingobium mangrovi (ex Hu et al. 2023)]|uniref:Cytochrome c family protein n=1 Tax=Novosphingobium mangrovi (ex Hu et al. 2023) TaxID=2930094 RepID=A0ABT0AFA6_9SPHN|nr:cytochrome c family protein [Novosphingobium mangrovi (ex Hu et al. 2023)]MCJ1961888.1 cytochrome c family protein [Novosphingobium mangrovi (ex Hu et al. 2023)]